RRAEGAGLDHAQVHLDPFAVEDRALRLAPGDHFAHLWERREALHDGVGPVRRREDVDVADRLHAPAQRARDLDLPDGGILAQGKDEALGHRQGAAQGRPRAARAPRVDALLEVLRRLLLEARDFEDPPGEDLALEALDRVDAELLVPELRLASADAA